MPALSAGWAPAVAYRLGRRWAAPRRWALRPDRVRLLRPVLIVAGADGKRLSREAMTALEEEIPDTRSVEISEAGYPVQLEPPERCLEGLLAFLDRPS